MPAINVAIGIVTKGQNTSENYTRKAINRFYIKKKTAVLGTSCIIRKVLQSGT
jgi:hypothetical protein